MYKRQGTEIVALIRRMSLVIAMRLHTLIFAAGQGVPMVGVVYDPKVSGFLDYLGQDLYLPLEEASAASLCDLIDTAMAEQMFEAENIRSLRELAVSGRETFIVPSASMTVHPVRMTGLMIAAPQSYRYFERVQESIVSFVARHSRITEDAFRQLMLADGDMSNDVGTILYGSQAVQLGLIDRLGTLSDALEALYAMIGKNG